MKEFWENKFKDEKLIWGNEPTESAIETAEFFHKKRIKGILLPGIGYGRNANAFIEKRIEVVGIEISGTAIKTARKSGFQFPIFHGSVLDMPFDNKKYEGIFCYSLLHLFNKKERVKILNLCYNQLQKNGLMVFVVVSTKTDMFGKGKLLSKNRYQLTKGLDVFFYNEISIKNEFSSFGLISVEEIDEPIKHIDNEPALKCYIVKCKKSIE